MSNSCLAVMMTLFAVAVASLLEVLVMSWVVVLAYTAIAHPLPLPR